MIGLIDLLTVLLLPATVAAIILWWCRWDGGSRISPVGTVTALTMGGTAAFVVSDLRGYWAASAAQPAGASPAVQAIRLTLEAFLWPPDARHYWVFVMGVVIAVTWTWPFVVGRWGRWGWLMLAVVCSGLAARLLWGSVYLQSQWSPLESVVRITGMGCVAGLLWFGVARPAPERWTAESTDLDADRCINQSCLLELAAITGLLSISLACSGSIVYGMLAAAQASSLCGGWLIIAIRKGNPSRRGIAGAAVVPACVLLLLGSSFSDLKMTYAIVTILTVAASIPWNGMRARRLHSDVSCMRQLSWRLLVLVPAVAATVMAVTEFIRQANSNPYSGY